MNDIVKKQNSSILPSLQQELTVILNSLAKIEEGKISSNDMLARMLLIEGSEAWSGLLADAQKSYPDPHAKLAVSKEVYLHIAKKALQEAEGGSSVGLDNAKEALQKAYLRATGSLTIKELQAMLPADMPKLAL